MSKATDPQLFASGYERNRLDRYWTNPWMTDEFFRCVEGPFPGLVPNILWECAAGRGDMSRAIAKHDKLVYSTDIDMGEFDRSIGPGHEKSFLDEFELPTIDTSAFGYEPVGGIMTNPPYSEPWRGIADDFIEHGLSFMYEGGISFMAMLLRSEFRSGKSKRRREKFGDCVHYFGELVLTTRPRWDYGDPDAPENAAPRHNFSWFIWVRDARDPEQGIIQHPVQLFSYMPKGFKP